MGDTGLRFSRTPPFPWLQQPAVPPRGSVAFRIALLYRGVDVISACNTLFCSASVSNWSGCQRFVDEAFISLIARDPAPYSRLVPRAAERVYSGTCRSKNRQRLREAHAMHKVEIPS